MFKLSLACLAVGAASGCKTADQVIGTTTPPYAAVRFINALPDSSGSLGLDFRFVDVLENNAFYHMSFRNTPSAAAPFISTATEFRDAVEGSRHFRVFLDDTLQSIATAVVVDTTVSLVAGHKYTAIEWGNARSAGTDKMRFNFFEEAPTDPVANVAFRAINATNAAVDVRVYPSTSTAAATAVTWTIQPYSVSPWTNFAPGVFAFPPAPAAPTTAAVTLLYNVVPAGSPVTATLFADAAAFNGAPASCSGQPPTVLAPDGCLPGQFKDFIAQPGANIAGSAVTGVIFPKVGQPEAAPGAPTATLSAVAGNVDNGPHTYKVTLLNGTGETTPGTASATVTVVNKAVAGQINLTNIAVGGALVKSRNIYRLTNAGYLLLTTLADNTTTTYTDNIADASLGTQAPPINNSTMRTPQGAAFQVPAIAFMWDRRPPAGCDPKYC